MHAVSVRVEAEATVTVDRAWLRKLVAGWKPGMTVEVRVDALKALLDELDKVDELEGEIQRLLFLGRKIQADSERLTAMLEDDK